MKTKQKNKARRGTATIEAILALSVFIIVWAGVLYMGRAYTARLELKSKVRACAWIQSAGYCSADVDCSTSLSAGGGGGGSEEILSGLGGDEGKDDGLVGAIRTMLSSQVDALFGERATVAASKEVARPVQFGGESVAVGASYSLPCNTRPISADTLAGQMMGLVKEMLF